MLKVGFVDVQSQQRGVGKQLEQALRDLTRTASDVEDRDVVGQRIALCFSYKWLMTSASDFVASVCVADRSWAMASWL